MEIDCTKSFCGYTRQDCLINRVDEMVRKCPVSNCILSNWECFVLDTSTFSVYVNTSLFILVTCR